MSSKKSKSKKVVVDDDSSSEEQVVRKSSKVGKSSKSSKVKVSKTKSTKIDEEARKKTLSEPVSFSGKNLADELEALLALKDEELGEMPDEKILEMRKSLNPYGRTIKGSDKILSFSITQISHEYWKKFITTSMVGYLFRMCNEWKVPNGVPVHTVYEYLDDEKVLDTPELTLKKNDKNMIYDYEFNRQWMKKRKIVMEFLEEMFQFNPDEHVRSSYKPNYADKSRTPLETMAARIATQQLDKVDPKFRAEKELHNDIVGLKKKKIRKIIKGKDGKIREIIKELPVVEPITPMKKPSNEKITENGMKDPDCKDTVQNIIPPHDIYGRFKMYYQENYEQLREAVENLYCEKPELELAINPYCVHDTEEEAKEFRKQHAEEVIAEIFPAHTGKWNFFDCFKEQREGVNFYNKNTAVLEEIVKQVEKDEKLGKDLMEKRVIKEKKKNEVESGPDSENFKKWREENSDLQKLGAKHIGDMADEDCVDDAIQVDVWRVAKGGLEITKDKFLSQAEAPTFVKEANDKARLKALGINPDEKHTVNVKELETPEVPASVTALLNGRADNL
jgi:hypothetical protein